MKTVYYQLLLRWQVSTALGALALLLAAASSVNAQLVYTESFRFENAAGWEFSQGNTSPGPRLTAAAVPVAADPEFGAPALDNNGNGWLRLATTTGEQSNAVALDTSFAAQGATITIAFDFAFWKPGTNPADGITAFFWDASQPFNPGGFGGSLGYANRDGTIPGLAGGYVGAGLDVFGNYSNPTESRNGGTGMRPGEVAVRGPGSGQTGYEFLAGTGSNGIDSLTDTFGAGFSMDFINSPKRPDQDAVDYRRFEMTLDAANNLTVRMQNGYDGTMTDLFTVAVPGVRPDQLRFGFAGSTGGSVEVYEIRNLEVRVDGGTNAFYWDNQAGNTLWNTGLNWDQNVVPANHSHVYFTDQFPDTKTPQTVNVNIAPILNSMTFNGPTPYTLTGSNTITFDTDGNGPSYLNILNSPNGNASHSVAANLAANNALQIQNLVAQSLTLSGDIAGGSHTLTIVTGAGGTTTASGVISGSGPVTTKGNGTTVFSGNNTYTGTTTVEQGTLRIEHPNALGTTGSGTTVQSGATLALAGGNTFAAEPLTISGTGTHGQGALYNAANDNTWAGTTTLAANAGIGAASNTQLTLTGNINGAGNTVTFLPQTDGTIAINSTISGTGTNVIYAGQGTNVIGYGLNHTYTGTTTIRSGTVISNSSVGEFSENAFGNSSTPIQLGDSGTASTDNISLIFNTTNPPATPWQHVIANRQINVNDFGNDVTLGVTGISYLEVRQPINLNRDLILYADAPSDLRINNVGASSGQLTGTGDLYKTGEGLLQLQGNQSYSGNFYIQEGTVRITNSGTSALDSSGRVIMSDTAGALLELQRSETIGSLAGGGSTGGNVSIVSGATLTTGGDNTSTTFSGALTGVGNLTKSGSGTMTFDGTNTVSGTLTVANGTVALGANNVFADTMGLTLSGGTFQTAGYADTMGLFTLTSNSTLDYLGTPGGYLTFADMTRSGGTLTIDNWSGSFSGNGDTRLQVLDNNLGSFGTGPGNLSNITFTGWGNARLIDLGGGLYEIVPQFTGQEWDGSNASNNWNAGTVGVNTNWRTAGNATDNNTAAPSGNGQTALFRDLDPGLNGKTISLNGNRTLGTLIFDNQGGQSYTIANNTLTLNSGSTAPVYITASGNGSPTISSRITLSNNPLNISNNSTGTLTLNGDQLRMGNNGANSNITVGGAGLTVISSQLRRDGGNSASNGAVIKNGTGTLRLTNNSNNYSGGTILNAGTLQIGANGALGSGELTINGGNLEAFGAARTPTNAYTIGGGYNVIGSNNLTFSGAGTVAAGNHAVNVASGLTHTYSGNLTGSGGLTATGPGIISFTGGTKTFSGGLTVNNGTVNASRGGNITLGAADGANNIAGSGNITVNTGGTFNLTQTANNAITLRGGSTLANNGGTLNVTSTGNNEARDFFIGTDASNTGTLLSTGGTTNITVGDDIRVRANSAITVSGGTVNLNPADAFITEGTSGNAATIAVSNTGSLNIDITSARSDNNQITLGQHDTLNITGSNANATFIGQSNSAINLNGTTTLASGGTLTTQNGTTTLGATAQLNGGSAPDKGTLVVQNGNLTVNNAALIVNAPNLTFNASGSQTFNGAAPDTSVENLGTVTITGGGTVALGTNLNNVQAQRILISGGTLLNSTSDQIENFTPMTLANGTWNTGGHSEVLGTLTLSADSTINLGSGASVINFANSAGESWTADQTLLVTNWSGNTSGGGTDQLIFGNSASALTSSQLGQISFVNPAGFAPGTYGAAILPSGEVVPFQPIPEPSTYALGGLLTLFLAWREWKKRRVKKAEGKIPHGEKMPQRH